MTVLKAKVDGNWVTVGGIGAGTPAGGTTNQILSKKSAADYDTQWTSTPVLTDLSIVDATTPTLIVQRTGGSPPMTWYTQMRTDGFLMIGHNSDPNQFNIAFDPVTLDLHGGGTLNGLGLAIAGNATITGTLTSKHVLAAFAHINQTGADNGGFGFSSISKFGTGSYRMITDRGYSYLWAMGAPWWINNTNVEAHSTNGNTIEIFSYSSSTHQLQDGHVTVIAVGIL